jgi:hypothetical protein
MSDKGCNHTWSVLEVKEPAQKFYYVTYFCQKCQELSLVKYEGLIRIK